MNGWDLALLRSLNQYTGRWYALDLAAALVQDNDLIKGAPFVAAFVWFWFRPSARQGRRRAVILNSLPAVFVSLVLNRTIAVLMPFRTRPMADPSISLNPPQPGITIAFDLENWSSFPSDHATFFFAMVASLWLMSRPAALAAALYAVMVVCLPRAYYGIHYPFDLAAGALLGIVTGWAVNRVLGDRLLGPAIRLRAGKPEWFYTLAFLAAFETAAMFRNFRRLQRGFLVDAVHSVRDLLHAAPAAVSIALLALFIAVLSGAVVHLYRRARRTQALSSHSD